MAEAISDSLVLIGRRGLRHIPRTPEKLLSVTMAPIVFVLVFGYLFGSAINVPGGGYREFVMAGIFAQVMLAGAASTAVGVADDLGKGLVDRFRSLPMTRSAVLVGRTVGDLALSAISIAVMAALGLAIGWRVHAGVLSALAGIVLLLTFGYLMAWAGALLGLVLRRPEAANALSCVVLMPLAFLSNAFVPLGGLPGWLRVVAEWNPLSAVVSACRQLFGNSGTLAGDSMPARPWPGASLEDGDVSTADHATTNGTRRRIRGRSWPGTAAAVWAVAFAVVHFYWALGGRVLLTMSFRGATNTATVMSDGALRFTALWGVGALCLVGAGVSGALARNVRARRVPSRYAPVRLLRIAAWAAAVVLILRGSVVALQDTLIVTGVLPPGPTANVAEVAQVTRWSLALFCPWFLAGGVLFALTAAAVVPRARIGAA